MTAIPTKAEIEAAIVADPIIQKYAAKRKQPSPREERLRVEVELLQYELTDLRVERGRVNNLIYWKRYNIRKRNKQLRRAAPRRSTHYRALINKRKAVLRESLRRKLLREQSRQFSKTWYENTINRRKPQASPPATQPA